MLPAGSGMGRSPGMAPHAQPHVAQLCATGTSDGISAALIYAGADVNVDVSPKERPGYTLVHLAACSSPGDLAVSSSRRNWRLFRCCHVALPQQTPGDILGCNHQQQQQQQQQH